MAAEGSVGSIVMLQSGDLVLSLRVQGPGLLGDATVTYRPGDEDYDRVLAHVGGLSPGGEKSVPPFPDHW